MKPVRTPANQRKASRLWILCAVLMAPAAALGIELGQIDDFEDGGLAGWQKGARSNDPPANISSGGPTGAGDNFLQNASSGGVGPDSRQAIFNTVQWAGDYAAAGVIEIGMQARNTGETALFMRIALEGGPGPLSWFSSTQSIVLPADGVWYDLSFGLNESELTRVTGTQSLSAVLSNATELRILSSQSGPDFRGDTVASLLGIDNVVAMGVADTDGDGVPDDQDAFPNDPTETTDTDGDNIGNNADTDDDNDGVPDAQDDFPEGRFADALPGSFAFQFIENLARAGVTGGCGGNDYCPNNPVTRAQMAVFLERGMRGSDFLPPAASGNVFLDVGAGDFAAAFIEQLFADGITGGCGGNNYCPNDLVTRAQMAVFLLRARNGSSFVPPPATGVFADVPLGSFAVAWIEQLAAEGITGGCGGGNYCPNDPVTRAQMAVFLVRAFDINFAPGSLSSAFDSNNGGTGNMIDVTTGGNAVEVTSIDVNVAYLAGTPFNVDVYTTPGSFEGTITAAPGCVFNCSFDLGDWTLVASGSAISAGQDLPSFVDVDDFVLGANATTGLWIFLTDEAGLVDQFRYTNGNVQYANSVLTITPSAGTVGTTPETATVVPDRQWNGTIYYLTE